MNIQGFRQLFRLRDLRGVVFGAIVLIGGGILSAVTVYAHRTQQTRLAAAAAAISLIFVLLILIFVVPPLARNASKEASQLNLPFEFTMGGAVMFGLLLIVGFSAWNTGNNLLFLILSFLTAAMIIGFVAGALMLKKVDVKMRFPETIFAGEPTPIYVSLQNRKRIFPSFSVVAEVRGKKREESVTAGELRGLLPGFIAKRLSRAPVLRRTLDYFSHIPRDRTSERRSEHVFPERGRFLIKDFEISTRFPFAFFRHRRRLPAKETELVVFPRREPIEGRIEKMAMDAGKIVVNKRGSGQDLLALRSYLPNDDLRLVDWKATARSQNLMVREYAAEDDKKVVIILDDRVPVTERPDMTIREKLNAEQEGDEPLRSERFEAAVRRTAALLNHFGEIQAEVTFLAGSAPGIIGMGSDHIHECLRRLAVIEPTWVENVGSGLPDGLDEIRKNASIFLVSTFPDAELPAEIAARAVIYRI
ncbi:MAG: DUF58 domain-containing protein [Acidobacteria bacterium]|nr:DUF58 domain-containing protein [Acidobacteriota bacterium]